MLKTFYFNTGVKRGVPVNERHRENAKPVALGCCQVWRNGTKQIPFCCEDTPVDAVFLHACDRPDCESSDVIVREIHNSSLLSKYAHFRI